MFRPPTSSSGSDEYHSTEESELSTLLDTEALSQSTLGEPTKQTDHFQLLEVLF